MIMGILDKISKNPTLIGLGVIAVLAFVCRDKISAFASGISGGAETVSNLGQTGNILSENLLGNLTGIQDIFKGISDFKFPSFELPTFNFDLGLDKLFAPTPSTDFTETAQNEARANRSRETFFTTQPIENFNVQTQFPDQTFQGGGPSFIGGSVSEIPVERLSLSQIIDRFMVTASQATDIRARALDYFGGFDFGTNTGSGIGNIPVIPNIGQTSGGFQGLTPEEIALRLTGGNTSNF